MSAELLKQALEALETASNGLSWYRDRHPESTDGSDDEADLEIEAAIAALRAAQPAAERVPFDPLAEFGFMLEQRRDVWVVVDDCGGTTPASLTERVMWDAIVKSRGITATSGKESRHD